MDFNSLKQELQELRSAKFSAVAILFIGLGAGWVGASALYSQQIAVQATQISALQDANAAQRPLPPSVLDAGLSQSYVIALSIAAILLLLILAVLFWPKKAAPVASRFTPMRVLERFYMNLGSMKGHVHTLQ